MASSLGVKNYVVQARKTAINGNYDYLPRIISDVGTLFQKYQTLYPGEVEIQGFTGKVCQLFIQGSIDLFNPVTRKESSVKIKITFLKDYPKSKPTIALQNTNDQVFDPNPAYISTGLARYERSPKDNKMYLFLQFLELKTWSPSSDIIKIISDIERRLTENPPFIKRNATIKQTKMGAILSTPDQSNPALRNQLLKTKNQLTDLQHDFEALMTSRDEIVLAQAYNEVIQRELCVKYNELDYMQKTINHMVSQFTTKNSVDEGSFDQFLEMTPQSKKLLTCLSERDALEECLQYLKNQLKNGVKIATLNDSFKKLFEDFFMNEMALNQP